MTASPLILTARFDPGAAVLFQRQRDAHFPSRLNIVPAHCTLFHHLPGDRRPAIAAAVGAACAGIAPIPFATAGVRLLGRGVAYVIAAPPLIGLRRDLAGLWADDLTPQDRQPFAPHVTIQNKVAPQDARALHARIEADRAAVTGLVLGLDLWTYRGGPWEAAVSFNFGGPAAAHTA